MDVDACIVPLHSAAIASLESGFIPTLYAHERTRVVGPLGKVIFVIPGQSSIALVALIIGENGVVPEKCRNCVRVRTECGFGPASPTEAATPIFVVSVVAKIHLLGWRKLVSRGHFVVIREVPDGYCYLVRVHRQ